MKRKTLHRNAGFTLIEVMVSVVLSAMILTSAYAAFQGIMKSQIRLSGVMSIQRSLFYLNEKLGKVIQAGGTLDYEEYFNRRILGYDKFFTPSGWTFTKKSNYGNGDNPSGRPQTYFCGRDSTVALQEDSCLETGAVGLDKKTFSNSLLGKHMAYGQYGEIGFNYKSRSGYPTPIKLPPIFPPLNTSLNKEGMDELYLIKKLPNGTYERTFFRHIIIQDPAVPLSLATCTPSSSFTGCLGKLQMTKMVSCDIFNAQNQINKPDGIIDVWVKHSDFGGLSIPCDDINSIDEISGATDDLVWADISSPDMNIIRAQFLPRPLKIPSRMSGVGELALSPMVQMHLEVKLSQRVLTRGLLQESENTPYFLTTTFDLENS